MAKSATPSALGIPDGSVVSMYAFVVLGTANEAKRAFIYEDGNTGIANYSISGTVLDNSLGLVDVM